MKSAKASHSQILGVHRPSMPVNHTGVHFKEEESYIIHSEGPAEIMPENYDDSILHQGD
jgi:hypothetical protein